MPIVGRKFSKIIGIIMLEDGRSDVSFSAMTLMLVLVILKVVNRDGLGERSSEVFTPPSRTITVMVKRFPMSNSAENARIKNIEDLVQQSRSITSAKRTYV
jgi:hypothetical protein